MISLPTRDTPLSQSTPDNAGPLVPLHVASRILGHLDDMIHLLTCHPQSTLRQDHTLDGLELLLHRWVLIVEGSSIEMRMWLDAGFGCPDAVEILKGVGFHPEELVVDVDLDVYHAQGTNTHDRNTPRCDVTIETNWDSVP